MVLSSIQCSCKQYSVCSSDSAGFNALYYYVLFCLFVSTTCILQSVCVHTMDFVCAYKRINK